MARTEIAGKGGRKKQKGPKGIHGKENQTVSTVEKITLTLHQTISIIEKMTIQNLNILYQLP